MVKATTWVAPLRYVSSMEKEFIPNLGEKAKSKLYSSKSIDTSIAPRRAAVALSKLSRLPFKTILSTYGQQRAKSILRLEHTRVICAPS